MMTAVQRIRAATAEDHETVDAAFGGLGFSDRASYAQFLAAHALALPAVEAALADLPGLPARRPRAPLIGSDLAALGLPMPAPLPFAPRAGAAAGFGASYVIEGSRLGGGLLARKVPAGLPSAYLADTHRPGEWRAFLIALENAAAGEAWIEAAIAAARETFALYRQAAAAVPAPPSRSGR